MGTSIELYVEVYDEKKQEWIADEKLTMTGRNYKLFAALANVRNEWGIIPIQPFKEKDQKDQKDQKKQSEKLSPFVQQKMKDHTDPVHIVSFKDCGPESLYWNAFKQSGPLCRSFQDFKNNDNNSWVPITEVVSYQFGPQPSILVVTPKFAAEIVEMKNIELYVSGESKTIDMKVGLKHQEIFASLCDQVITNYPKTLAEHIRFVFWFC
jgi:hypothetical protein